MIYPSSPVQTRDGRESRGDKNSEITPEDNIVRIASQPGSSGYSSALLCDLSGRVYFSADYSDPAAVVEISVEGLLPGTYLLYLESDGTPEAYKFRK